MSKRWSKKDVEYLSITYSTTRAKDIAAMIGRSEAGIIAMANKLRLRKDPEFMRECAEAGQFKKGGIPINKGKKQSEYMSEEAIERTKLTRFKKGNEPHNTKFDGAERISKDGYIEIRIRKGKYVHKHRLLWEQAHGNIPDGFILVCRSQNKLNSNPENWELITMAENMKRNSGPMNLNDNIIAAYLAKDGRKTDHVLKSMIKEYPELIKAKRSELLLIRKIKEHGKK